MSKRKKRLERLRQNPNNVSFDDLKKVLEDYRFFLVRVSGSHHTFEFVMKDDKRQLIIPYHRPVKLVYVRQVLNVIDELIERYGQDLETGESDD